MEEDIGGGEEDVDVKLSPFVTFALGALTYCSIQLGGRRGFVRISLSLFPFPSPFRSSDRISSSSESIFFPPFRPTSRSFASLRNETDSSAGLKGEARLR
jgi:hypothetical protein